MGGITGGRRRGRAPAPVRVVVAGRDLDVAAVMGRYTADPDGFQAGVVRALGIKEAKLTFSSEPWFVQRVEELVTAKGPE